jgi:hypothetical protein
MGIGTFQTFNRLRFVQAITDNSTWRGLARFENYQNVKTFSGVERLYTLGSPIAPAWLDGGEK